MRATPIVFHPTGIHDLFGLGGLLATGAYYLSVTYAERFPSIRTGHEAWRYTLLSGLIPAIPLIFVRPFLAESPIWQEKKVKGTLKRPNFAELFRPAFRRTTLVTTLLVACSYAVVSRARDDCRALAVCLSGRSNRVPAPSVTYLSPSGLDCLFLGLFFRCNAQSSYFPSQI